ncbi:MAG: hypothetical protein HY272_04235 [Gammaproteobacteria bacterium]|nr:hypothetical protein [Gammaproteobacteria bacterium]
MSTPRFLPIFLCTIFSFGNALAEDAAAFVGAVHPPLVAGCKEQISRTIYTDQKGTVLSFSYVECTAGNSLWFNKFDGRKNGVATWKVQDAETVTLLPHQTFLDIGCHGKTRPDDYVVAVGTWVKRGAGGYLTEITAAWALDTEKLKLVELTPGTVSCVVEQY